MRSRSKAAQYAEKYRSRDWAVIDAAWPEEWRRQLAQERIRYAGVHDRDFTRAGSHQPVTAAEDGGRA